MATLAVTAVSGFVVVHVLDKSGYAQYTLLTACVSLVFGLSDLGLSNCYLPVVGARAHDARWVLQVCRRIYGKRWLLLAPAGLAVLAYWLYATWLHHWTRPAYLLASALLALGVPLALREHVSRCVLSILQNTRALSRIGLTSAVARMLLLLAAVLCSSVLDPLVGISLATLAAALIPVVQYNGVPALHPLAGTTLSGTEARQVDRRIGEVLRPLILFGLFHQFQSSITILLVATLGHGHSLAEVGALTRPTLVLSLIDRVTAVLLFPVVARKVDSPHLARLVAMSICLHLVCMAAILATAIFTPGMWMWLIGSTYAGQADMLWMAFLAAILLNASGFAFAMLTAIGDTRGQALLIPVVLCVQGLYLLLGEVTSTRGALLFSIATTAAYCAFQYSKLGLVAHARFSRAVSATA